tara:strand:+ start:5017 stop:6738 length:1722 start_codon:yes stop_codon:yes gene_type:complete
MNRRDRRKNKVINKASDLINEFIPAFNLHKSGDLDKAEILYHKILAKNPLHFDALRHLGILNQDRHLLDQALAFFIQAMKVNPKSHEIYNNIGSIMFQQYRQSEAKLLCEKSLSLKHDYLPALNNLVLLCYRLNFSEEALKIGEKAIKLYPNDLRAQTNYALALSISGSLDKAVNIFKKVAKINPNADNLKNLGTTYRDSGEFEKSHNCFVDALKERPDDESIFFNLSASKLYKPNQNILKKFEQILYSKENLDYNQKTAISFSLYNSFRKLKDYKKSGTFLIEGNKYANEWIKSDIKKEEILINELKLLFNREFIKKRAAKVNLQKKLNINPIFILGMPRSGTTLCEQILFSHSKVAGGGEIPDLTRVSGIDSTYNLDIKKIDQFKKLMVDNDTSYFEKKAEYYLNKLKKISSKHQFITDKMPHNFILIGFIKMILPNAKIVYCKRNPMDNCFSLYAHKFVDMNHGYCYDQEILGEYYKLHSDLMEHWLDLFGKEIFTLEHDILLDNQEKQSKELIRYCGLDWENACLEFYKSDRQVQTASNEQVREPINKNSVAAWKNYKEFLKPLIKSLN